MKKYGNKYASIIEYPNGFQNMIYSHILFVKALTNSNKTKITENTLSLHCWAKKKPHQLLVWCRIRNLFKILRQPMLASTGISLSVPPSLYPSVCLCVFLYLCHTFIKFSLEDKKKNSELFDFEDLAKWQFWHYSFHFIEKNFYKYLSSNVNRRFFVSFDMCNVQLH